jgi:hypothetical protein
VCDKVAALYERCGFVRDRANPRGTLAGGVELHATSVEHVVRSILTAEHGGVAQRGAS